MPVDALCEEVEQRNRLRLLTPFLEQLVAEGSKDAGVHSALGKILVDSGGAAAGGASSSSSSSAAGTNAEHFLTTNPYYDSRAVGKYCEKRDPHLACVAYRRGQCDDELVRCTTAHSLFKAQARYVVERADAELWAKVLAEGSEGRRPLVDQVVSTALPECRNPEQVSVAVKAFMAAGLQSELIELLEKIVLMANSSFASNHNLQNLLIITAIKSDKARVADYISRLDNFDGPAVGEIAVGYEMFDEAFEIYKKFGLKAQAIKVLLEHGKAGNKAGGDGGAGGESPTSSSSTPAVASPSSLAKADAYAASVDDPAVWAELGHAHLAAGDAAAAIAAYTKAGDGSRLADVVAAATQAGAHGPLIEYLLMARAKAAAGGAPGSLKGDPAAIDSELVRVFFFFFFCFFCFFFFEEKKIRKKSLTFFFLSRIEKCKKKHKFLPRQQQVHAYAASGDTAALEAFLAGPNKASLGPVADRLFASGSFDAARAVYARIPNWGKLASCLVRLRQFQPAIEAARKANTAKCWKEVCWACVEEKEFKMAQLAALNVVVAADDLAEVVERYSSRGLDEELAALLESAIGLERAHMGIFTELGILYARRKPEKLMEHLKLFAQRLNVPRLIRTCEDAALWRELVFLYCTYDEHDNAALVMMAHPGSAWEHSRFKDVAVKVANPDVHYKAVSFYLSEHPDLLVDLLKVLEPRLDHARVVAILRKAGHLALGRDYLLAVQKQDVPAVNDAVNELLIADGDAAALAESVANFTKFDALALAATLAKHASVDFRRVGARIYKQKGKWAEAVALAKADGLHKDAIATAAASGSRAVAEDLARHFVEKGEKECFAATLFACAPLLAPDVVLELAWAHGVTDAAMPFMIQALRDQTAKIDLLMRERDAARKKGGGNAGSEEGGGYLSMMPLALPAAPGSAQSGSGGPAF